MLPNLFHKNVKKHSVAEGAMVRQVSELQSKGADIVAEANGRPVELRRYGDVVSPEQHERYRELEEAARRALWAFAIARGLKSLGEGRVTPWDEATAARLRERFPGP
jgi:hypothetical protein